MRALIICNLCARLARFREPRRVFPRPENFDPLAPASTGGNGSQSSLVRDLDREDTPDRPIRRYDIKMQVGGRLVAHL